MAGWAAGAVWHIFAIVSAGPHLIYLALFFGAGYLVFNHAPIHSFFGEPRALDVLILMVALAGAHILLTFLDMLTFMMRLRWRSRRKESVLVIGAGLGGIEMSHRLLVAGYEPLIFDSGHEFGGTWRVNDYPGCKSDIETTQYFFTRWFVFYRALSIFNGYSTRSSLNWYSKSQAHWLGLVPRTTFRTTVERIELERPVEGGQPHYRVSFRTDGKELEVRSFDYVICCIGTLGEPKCDTVETSRIVHAAKLTESICDGFRGKKVCIVGAGCSGTQMVHDLVVRHGCSQVTICASRGMWFSPGSMVEHRGKTLLNAILVLLPFGTLFLRAWSWWIQGLLCEPTLTETGPFVPLLRAYNMDMLDLVGAPPSLKPTQRMFSCRVVVDYDFFWTLRRFPLRARSLHCRVQSYQELEGDAGVQVNYDRPTGHDSKEERTFDYIIQATGFQTDWNKRFQMIGLQGAIGDEAKGSGDVDVVDPHRSFFGLTLEAHAHGRLYFLFGPNTSTVCQSITKVHEISADAIVHMMQVGLVPSKRDIDKFQELVTERSAKWAGEKSWYITDGKNMTNWPGTYKDYKNLLWASLSAMSRAPATDPFLLELVS